MRLPLPTVIVNGGMNALYQQMLNNQILAAKAQYSQPLAQAQAQQAQGAAQNALAQGRFAPQYYAGQANTQTGIGQQELAAGQYAPSVARSNAIVQQAGANVANPYQNALLQNAQLQPGATQATINLTKAEQQNVGNTALQVPANAAANRALTLAQAYRQQNPNSTVAQSMSWAYQQLSDTFNSIGSNMAAASPPSAIGGASTATPTSMGGISYQGKVYPYTETKVVNGQTRYFIPTLNGWLQ